MKLQRISQRAKRQIQVLSLCLKCPAKACAQSAGVEKSHSRAGASLARRAAIVSVANSMSYRFFQNSSCEYFPCHHCATQEIQDQFSCLFCYCPLYHEAQCGGHYTLLQSGVKDCSNCLLPHLDYDYIVHYLMTHQHKEAPSCTR